jgi:hypothetical protein
VHARGEALKSSNKQNLILAIIAVAVLAGIGWVYMSDSRPAGSSTESVAALSAEVLSPTIFNDEKTRAAYQVAKDIPEVLSELPCFCGCMTGFGHKSNLFCFKDQHGAACDMCQNIALDAKKMHDQGLSIAQIQDNIKTKYARY